MKETINKLMKAAKQVMGLKINMQKKKLCGSNKKTN
jgi:hypothetical protein